MTRRLMGRMRWSCVVVLLLAACGHASGAQPVPPPALPADSIPGSETHTWTLDAERATAETLDPDSLSALLDRAGYVTGTERTFWSRGDPLDRVATRVLEFGSEEGAGAHLGWLGSHSADPIGDSEGTAPLDAPGSPQVFMHTPSGCCPKDTTKYLAAWRHERYVLIVIASGGMADRETLLDLVSRLDDIV